MTATVTLLGPASDIHNGFAENLGIKRLIYPQVALVSTEMTDGFGDPIVLLSTHERFALVYFDYKERV